VAAPDGAAPAGAESAEELFCLVTDLTDDEKYPAQALAAACPQRWTGSETTIKENEATITDAGPSRGPIFRSTTPDMIRQEFWAWLTATNLLRAEARRAARHAAGPARPRPARPALHVPAGQVSFTARKLNAEHGVPDKPAPNLSGPAGAAAGALAQRASAVGRETPRSRPAAAGVSRRP